MRKFIHGRSQKVYVIEDKGYGHFVKIKSTDGKITTSMDMHRDKVRRFEKDLEEFGYVETS